MALNYTFAQARNLFYTLTMQKSTGTSPLEGEQTLTNATNDLLHVAEIKTLNMLLPFYQRGMAPQLQTMEKLANYATTGTELTFAVPTDFLLAISAIANNTSEPCPLQFFDRKFRDIALTDPYAAPSAGGFKNSFVPAYISKGNINIVTPLAVVHASAGLTLTYIKSPLYPTTFGTSDLHLTLFEMTVYNMMQDYLVMDSDDQDIALAGVRDKNMQQLHQAIVSALNFDPYKEAVQQ